MEVISELYAERDYITNLKPILNSKSKLVNFFIHVLPVNFITDVVSQFSFTLPATSPTIDEDGDLIVKRKPKSDYECNLEIGKNKSFYFTLCGMQNKINIFEFPT